VAWIAISGLTGSRPLGWYTGRDSPNTRRLVADYGGFEYDSDYYGDDLPFWMQVRKTDGSVVPQLIVPYTLDCNDMRFALPQGYSHADPFFQYLKDSFDVLYAEGDPPANRPKMMSIGMHCRLLGRPGRITALQRFLDHIAAARPRLGLPPHRHRAPLEAPPTHPFYERHVPRLNAIANAMLTFLTLTLEQLNAASPAEAPHLLDGLYEHSPWIPAGAGAAPVSLAGAAQARHGAGGARGRARRPAGADPRPPRAGRQGHGGQQPDGRIHQRAKQGGPDALHARGVCRIQQLNARLQRALWLSLHPGRARAARHGPVQAARSSTPLSGACTTTPTSSCRSACATSTASPRSA
jgi:hypothetical protein